MIMINSYIKKVLDTFKWVNLHVCNRLLRGDCTTYKFRKDGPGLATLVRTLLTMRICHTCA